MVFSSIRTKLICILILLGGLPLVIVGAVSYRSAANALMIQTRQQLDNVALKTVEQVDHFFEVAQKDIELLSNSPFVRLAFLQYEFNQRLDTARRLLEDYCKKNDYYNNVYLIDLSGKCILSIADVGENRDFFRSLWFYQTLERGLFLSDLGLFQDKETSGVILGKTVYDFEYPDQKIGVLVFDIKNQAFLRYVESLKIGEKGMAFLIHNQGHLIFHPNHDPGPLVGIDMALEGDSRFKELLYRMMAGQKGFGSYTFQTAEKFLVYRPCSRMDWSLGITVFESELMSDIHRYRNQVLTFTAMVFGLLLVVSLLFANGMTLPIRKLINGARQIRNGTLDQKISITSRDEFSVLAREFNLMASALKTSMDEILDLKNFKEDIFRNLSSGIITVDELGKMSSINQSARAMLGCSGNDKEDHGPSVKKILELLRASLNDNEDIIGHELELVTVHGETAYVEVNTSKFTDISGGLMGAIADIRDITRRKRMEELMVRVDKLASLGQLSAGMAHEIRNPLAGMKTSVQVLGEKATSEDEKCLIAGVLSEINRLNKIVSDLLSFSRPSQPRSCTIDLTRVLENVLEMVKEKTRKYKIQVSRDWEKELPRVVADQEQLYQIFLNLVLNSIMAMEGGGSLTLSAKIFRDRDGLQGMGPGSADIRTDKRPYIAVRFKDTGHGIARENLSRVFNPFFSTSPKGTGLGLPIVHKLLEKNKGFIFIDSVVGQGTRVLLLLPCAETQEDSK